MSAPRLVLVAGLLATLVGAGCKRSTPERDRPIPTGAVTTMNADLEQLRQQLPDPFRYDQELGAFFQLDRARALTSSGQASADALVGFVETSREPALVRVAVLLLSRLDPALFYDRLLAAITQADRANIEAMEPGYWRIGLAPDALARGLAKGVDAGHPEPVLLLQRPAAVAVKAELFTWAEQGVEPLSLYAAYALAYVVEPADRARLDALARTTRVDEVRKLATGYVAKLPPAP